MTAPAIHHLAPVAPGSDTSLAAALDLSNPLRARSHRKIMLALASVERPVSMRELARMTAMEVSSICARLSELRPMWIETHSGACRSSVKPTLFVDGFTLTPAGLRRVVAEVR